jgi:uncharacterized membrane protein
VSHLGDRDRLGLEEVVESMPARPEAVRNPVLSLQGRVDPIGRVVTYLQSRGERVNAIERPPAIVRWTLRLEDATKLDTAVEAVEPTIRTVFGTGARAAVLRGDWLGHALHPLLTDLVLGTWTSASLLDLSGGAESSRAAQRLIGAGLLAAGPTAWSGWAEWSAAGPRDKRVGLVHAVTNALAIGLYAGSWVARRSGRHRTGARLALVGATVAGVGGYLGSHLALARKLGSRHPAYSASR